MGVTAENVSQRDGITREMRGALAVDDGFNDPKYRPAPLLKEMVAAGRLTHPVRYVQLVLDPGRTALPPAYEQLRCNRKSGGFTPLRAARS